MGRMAMVALCCLLGACEGSEEPAARGAGALGGGDPAAGAVGGPAEPGAVVEIEGPSALLGLDATSRAAALRAPVPVLLLPEEWAARSTVSTATGFYAISAREGEIAISLHASDVMHDRGDGVTAAPPAREVRGRPARVLSNEGIRSVTWAEQGTHYVLDVECYRPFEDPRCTQDGFLLALADALVEVSR